MTLGIISDCIHTKNQQGFAASKVHIFVRQMEALSVHFDKVIICCPFVLYQGEAITAYTNTNISFIELPNVGGSGFKAKWKLLTIIPTWLKAFSQLNKTTDIVYQRFPNNLNIPGFFYFWLKKKKVFATYTGTWEKNNTEPFTYTFQKWLLKKLFRGPVFVYALQENLTGKMYSSISPSYSIAEWDEETEQVKKRVEDCKANAQPQLKLISVGTLIWYKNQQYILNTCVQLKNANIPFQLTLAGEGELRSVYEIFIKQNDLNDHVILTGNINFGELRKYYRQNSFVVQAPLSEGFGKVPIEGFFHGLIPILNNLTLASYMTGSNNERGFLFDVNDEFSLFNLLSNVYNNMYKQQLPAMIENGRTFAQTQTLEHWSNQIATTINTYFE